jgi:hypothetical protein
MCGVQPPSTLPWLNVVPTELPEDLKQFGCHGMVSVALVIGAGDADRRIPIWTLREWINRFLSQSAEGRVLLVGGNGECELAHALQLELSPLVLNRVWNACGRTSLLQLVQLLSRCQWIMGSDTGPLHLGVSCGAKAMGWYFSRARVHETGPYGEGHWVWQAEQTVRSEGLGVRGKERGIFPKEWPVRESVELMLGEGRVSIPEGWSLWRSDRDQNGVFFTEFGTSAIAPLGREHIWEVLSGEDLVKPDVLRDLLHTTRYSLSASSMMN